MFTCYNGYMLNNNRSPTINLACLYHIIKKENYYLGRLNTRPPSSSSVHCALSSWAPRRCWPVICWSIIRQFRRRHRLRYFLPLSIYLSICLSAYLQLSSKEMLASHMSRCTFSLCLSIYLLISSSAPRRCWLVICREVLSPSVYLSIYLSPAELQENAGSYVDSSGRGKDEGSWFFFLTVSPYLSIYLSVPCPAELREDSFVYGWHSRFYGLAWVPDRKKKKTWTA